MRPAHLPRALFGVVTAVCLALLLSIVISAVGRPSSGTIYSLAAVQAGLARDPDVWVNRTVRVRAIATGCMAPAGPARISPCAEVAGGLYGVGATNTISYTPVTDGPSDPWLSFLRRLPLLGSLAPPAQRLDWGVTGAYRVRFRLAPTGLCGGGACVNAVLLDAAPDS